LVNHHLFSHHKVANHLVNRPGNSGDHFV
jgi:hypothetical protein